MMKIAMLCAALLLSGVARAEAPGYVDVNRVRTTATEPLRLDAEFRADQQARNQKVSAAIADANATAQKAKPADQDAAWAPARRMQQEQNAAIKRRAEAVDAEFTKKLTAILAKLRAARHVPITAASGVILVPGVDLTDEAIGIWNQADTQGMAEENARLKAELAKAKPEPPKK